MGWWATATGAILFALALSLVPTVARGETLAFSVAWVPSFGVNLSFLIDGYTLFFTLLITGIGTLIFHYSHTYMAHHEHRLKFYGFMLAFMASMLGLVLSSNLIILYIFWEATTLSSYFLIGLRDREEEGRWNATQALLIITTGGIAMLGGFILLYLVTGTLELPELWAQADTIRESHLFIPIVSLILLGAFTKSALMPFHIWLPSAMVAPTPVSAYLHSVTMVKAGVFLVARLSPIFHGAPEWTIPTVSFGLGTMLLAGLLALRQTDLKALLAYSTVSQLGMLTALYGLGTELAVTAATVHLLSHATFKGAMFLVVGAVEHETGVRDLRRLGGLFKLMPFTGVFALIVALSSAGIPPLNGFISKELIYEAALGAPRVAPWLLPLVLVLGSVLTFAYSLRYFHGTFLGRPQDPSVHAHEAPAPLLLAPAVLALAVLALGIVPTLVAGDLIAPAVGAIAQVEAEVHLALWTGLGTPLVLSLVTIGAGLAAFAGQGALSWAVAVSTARYRAEQVYDAFIRFMYDDLPRVYWHLQNGSLGVYVVVIILFTLLLSGSALVLVGTPPFSVELLSRQGSLLEWGLAALLGVGAISVLFQRQRLGAVLSLSLVGAMVVGVYVIYSAPDLALTQLLVELLMAVLLVLGLRHMLGFATTQARRHRLALQAALATAFGALVTVLMLGVLQAPLFPSIASFYIENAERLAHGRNMVNVIVVDFRGYDTMGEITVLGIAALAVFAMLRFRQRGRG
ncbi:MAG: hydrogen gas-evolving membrane-bound hydrogenase subunit E, partial [Dehalococcoidia bacterium]